jgi:hypothetical protein
MVSGGDAFVVYSNNDSKNVAAVSVQYSEVARIKFFIL